MIILVLVLTFKYIFPQTEFVATNLIEHKIGSVGSSDDNKFYSSVMTFMGAMAAMLYLLYMILYDEMKLCNNHYSMLSINRRKVVSSFLMILFGMFCFTVVHIMPTDQSTFIETLAYTGLLLMILAFWYIVIAALNLAYINLDAAKTLKKEMKSSIKIKVSK
ncbi:MAG: hypothetical protein RLN62_01300 [Rickettsiales bacterium]